MKHCSTGPVSARSTSVAAAVQCGPRSVSVPHFLGRARAAAPKQATLSPRRCLHSAVSEEWLGCVSRGRRLNCSGVGAVAAHRRGCGRRPSAESCRSQKPAPRLPQHIPCLLCHPMLPSPQNLGSGSSSTMLASQESILSIHGMPWAGISAAEQMSHSSCTTAPLQRVRAQSWPPPHSASMSLLSTNLFPCQDSDLCGYRFPSCVFWVPEDKNIFRGRKSLCCLQRLPKQGFIRYRNVSYLKGS